MSSFLKGWRTRALSFLVFTLGLLQVMQPDFLAAFPDSRGMITLGIALAIYVLRQITTTKAGNAT